MYRLWSFGGVTLPVARPQFEAGTAPSQQRMIATIGGGVYDAAGTARARIKTPYDLSYECVARGTTAAALKTTLDALRALRGRESLLYRKALSGGALQWATARLMEIDYKTEPQHGFGLFQPLSMRWLVKTLWHGTAHSEDEGEDSVVIENDEETVIVTNGGNATANNVVLTVNPNDGTVTNFRIRTGAHIGADPTGACDLMYTGAITDKLTIDCSPERMTVLHGNDAAWQFLTLGPTHASDAWLQLQPGANSLLVNMIGGGSERSLNVAFSDTWE